MSLCHGQPFQAKIYQGSQGKESLTATPNEVSSNEVCQMRFLNNQKKVLPKKLSFSKKKEKKFHKKGYQKNKNSSKPLTQRLMGNPLVQTYEATIGPINNLRSQ